MFRNFVNRMPGTSVIAGSQDRRRRRASAHAQGLEILESRQLLSATVYTVDLTSDTGTSTSAAAGDLLYCLTRANADTNPDGTEIVFDPSVFNSTSPQTITLDSTLVLGNPAGPMSIQGPGAEIVTISGDNAVGVFQVSTGVSASIGDLTITDGSATDGAGIFNSGTLALTKTNIEDNVATALGGGIFSWGKLTLDGCQITGNSGGGVFASSDSRGLVHVSASDGTTISGNKAGGEAGGIAVSGGVLTLLDSSVTGNTGVLGAGILMDSSDDALNVTNSVISDNVVSGNGAGGIDGGGTMTITGSTISSNSGGFGGGIGTSGTLTISASTISDNTAGTAGGIVCSGTTLIEDKTIISGNQGGNQGGGIFNDGTLTIKDSTIGGPDLSDGNSANIGGGIADNYAGSVTVTDCTFEYNLAPNSSNGGAGEGAAIWSSTTLSVTGSTLSHNTAYYGGAIQVVGTATITNSQFTDNSARTGGAIASGDKLTVEGCTFDSNSAPSGSGGALYNSSGSATITGSTFSSNSAAGFGGGILVRAGQLTLEQTTVSGNTATYDGGGIFDEGKLIIEDDSFISKNTTNGNGGGIDTYGTVTISVAQSTVEDNSAGVDGGGIDDFQLNTSSVMTIDDSVISGNQGLGNTYGGGLTVSGTTTISDGSQITDNTGRYGGGIYNSGTLNISSSTVSGNTAPYGGGIDCFSTGTFTGVTMSGNTGSGINCFGNTTISDSTISKNTGGGIQNFGTLKVAGSTFASNSGSQGGALANFSGGSASITASTLTGNKVPYFGGGILVQSGTVTITNTTISGNTTSSAGGAVYNDNSGKFKAVNSTIVGNVSLGGTGTGGGIDAPANGDTTLENTIVVLNTDGTGAGATADDLAGGTLAAATAYDLVGTDKTGSLVNGNDGNLVGVSDPNLGSLAYNGGPTETIALQAGSPAIGAGSLALAVDAQGNPLVYDQRGVGYPRTANGQVDLGAFETAAATQSAPQVTVNPVNITYGTSLNDSQLSGTATVLISGVPENLPGTFSFGSLVGTVLGAGSGQTETVTFTPIDTTDYQSVQLPVTVNVAAALPLLSVNNVTLPEGTALDNSQLTGSAAWVVAAAAVDVPGTFSYTTVVGTVPPPGATIESVTFTPADSVDYSIETDRIIVTEQAGLEPVTVALATSANFVLPGQTVTFTVTVSPPNGDNNSPTGVVTLNVNGASGTLVNGVATITTSFAAGLTEVTASFGPNSQFLGGLSNTVYELAEPNLTPQASDYVSTAWSGAAFTPAEPVTWVDGTTHFIGLDAFGTIQAGIDGVAAGGVVHVAPGSYTEQLTINQNLTLVGSVQAGSSSSVIIQSPSGAGGNLITITNNANAQITNLALNDGTQSWTAIDAGGGSLTAAGLNVTGFRVGTAVENDSTATITASLFSGDGTGIVLGSGSSDNSSLTATGDSFINDNLGVDNIQSSGTANATLDWWGTATGPLNSNNPGGTGTPVSSQVDFSPWLGGSKTPNPQSLVFLTQAGGIYSVAPLAGNSSVSVTSNLGLAQTVPGGDTITFSGGGITVTIDGESGTSSLDNFIIMDNSVEYTSADGLDGTTVDFPSASVTRNVDAFGAANTFDIASTGAGGPFNLIGNSGANRFVLTNNFSLLGTITGDGSSTIDYSGYNTGVSVNLGNGTNGTGTGISGAIRGINAIVGTAFNDSLNAGSVANVFLTGGLGENQLTGIASGRTDVAETGVNFTLTNTSLTAPGIDDVLTRIKIAQLNDVLGGGTFSVSGWTGTGSLSAPLNNPDTVDATKGANFKLSDTSLSTADGMSMNLSGITTANLTDGSAGGVTFTVSGWTGGGSLVDGDTGGSFDAVTSTKGAGYTLSDTALTSTDGMSLSLSGLTSANLTDLSGANTFDVSGWDQAANLVDSGSTADTVDATKNASFTLSNSALESTDGMIVSMTGISTANLVATTGGQTFTVSAWTGNGSLTGGMNTGPHQHGVSGEVIASKKANFTLSNSELDTSDGMSMLLSGITSAVLTATIPNKTFTVSGWSGFGALTSAQGGGTGADQQKSGGIITAVKDGSFSLSNAGLTSSDGMTMGMTGFINAKLTDSGTGGNTISLANWLGTATLVGPGDTLDVAMTASTTLTNTSLVEAGLLKASLSGFTVANLTDDYTGGLTFTVSGWTGSGSLVDGDTDGSFDAVTSTKGAGYTLSDTALTSTDGMSLSLSGLTSANLTDLSGANTFDVSGWDQAANLVDSGSTADTVDATKNASFTLSNSALESTDGMIVSMTGISAANLVATTGGQTFTVSAWTGNGSLTGGMNTGPHQHGVSGEVIASKKANFTLSNSELDTSDGMSMLLSGITSAVLTATIPNKTFTVSGWSGFGTLTSAQAGGTGADQQKSGGIITAVKNGSFSLSNAGLTSSDGMTMGLTGFINAKLTDSGTGGNTISLANWLGTATLVGPGDTLDVAMTASTTLTNTSLVEAGLLKASLSGFTVANLTDDYTGGLTFTVSGWTGSGSLVDGDTGGSFDAVTSTKGAGYTLSDTALTSTDGMSLSLSGLTSANLTDLSGANTFDVSGWDQAANLADSGSTADTVDATKNASFTLTNTSLIATDGLIASLSRFGTANLISAFSDATFTVSSWNGSGSLTSGDETGGGGSTGTAHAEGLIATKNANFTLSDTSLTSTDGMSMSLSGITLASLTATTPNKTFTVSGWTGRAILTGGGSTGTGSSNSKGPTGTVVAVKDASFTLSNSRLTSTDGMNVELFSITTADLTDTSSGGNTIALNGWTGNGSLAGNSDTLNAVESGNVTLSNTALKVGSTSIQLSGLTAANLTVTAAAGQSSYVVDASSFSAGPANVTVGGSANAIVFGGTAGNDALTIATGATGNNILIGNGPGDSLTDNGSGYAILIGAGTGGDTLTGNGNDILISGTTVYDRDTSANIAALDAILANWASNATYAQRIALVENPPLHSPGLNGSTITPDAGSNTLQEASGETADQDLYIASSLDAVYPQDGEEVTII